jgi:curved DNA-binding protein
MAAKEDYYKVLGVPRDASDSDIKSAYRKAARKYHPDVNKDPDASEKFSQATEAYEVLSDPEKRKVYDRFGHAGLQGQPAGGPAQRGGGPSRGPEGGGFRVDFGDIFSGGGSPFMGMGLEEILDALRGGGGGGRRRTRPHRPRAAPRGDDIEHPVTLEFMEAVRGTNQTLRLQTTDAEGNVRNETLTVKIPPGVKEGARIRLRGKGRPGPGGAGDLYIIARIRPHEYFRREGNDIYLELPIGIDEAALGAKVDVPTLDGTTTMKIPPGTRSGTRLRLRGRGVAGANGSTAGDQYVQIKIVPPKELTGEAREMLESFRQSQPFDPRGDVPWK